MADCSTLLQQGLQLVQRATTCDGNGDYHSALRLYSLALEAFLSVLKMERNPKIRVTLNSRIEEYMRRAEELKLLLHPELSGDPPPTERDEVDSWLALPSVPGEPIDGVNVAGQTPPPLPGSPELASRLAGLRLSADPQLPSPPTHTSPIDPFEASPPPSDDGGLVLQHHDRDGLPLHQPTTTIPSETTHALPKAPHGYPMGSSPPMTDDLSFPPTSPQSGKTPDSLHPGVSTIAEDSLGHSYESLFAPLLNGANVVCIQEPNLTTQTQMHNLLRFAEVCVKLGYCNKLIISTRNPENEIIEQEFEKLTNELADSLMDHLIDLDIRYGDESMSAQVLCSTGWGVRLSSGLDMFKPVPPGSFRIGQYEQSLRPTKSFSMEMFRGGE